MSNTTDARIRELLAENPNLSVAEARAMVEGRAYNPDRDLSTFQRSLDEIRTAVLREFDHNVDVGELIVQAVAGAAREVNARGGGSYLTQNRPGSWEAVLVEEMVRAAGE